MTATSEYDFIPSYKCKDEVGKNTTMDGRLSLSSENSTSFLMNLESSNQHEISRKRIISSSSSESTMTDANLNIKMKDYCCILAPVILLIVLCCGFIPCVVFLFIRLAEIEITISQLQDFNDMCVPCADLQLGPFEEDNVELKYLEKKAKNGMDVCCAKTPNQTTKLIDLLLQKRQKVKCAQETINEEESDKCNSSTSNIPASTPAKSRDTIAAHLCVGLQTQLSRDNKAVPVRNWISSGSVAHARGVNIQNDRMKINTSGLYYVYSQIYLAVRYGDGHFKLNETHIFYHYVYRYNIIYPNGGKQLLLRSTRTDCSSSLKVYGDFTSYTGGVFDLKVGDELYVETTNLYSLSRDPKASFFGTFKIS